MILWKMGLVFLLAFTVGAEKKIELQDIEDDNLKSEKQSELEKSEPRSESSGTGTATGLLPLDFFKSGLLRYFESPASGPQHPRFVQQYAVSEPPERVTVATPKSNYGTPATQQAMVGYLSNVPMQIYLVPQYYNEQSQQATNSQAGVQYPPIARVATYQAAPEPLQAQTNNYIEVPNYVTPTGKAYIQQYQPQHVAYLTYSAQPTATPAQATISPVLTYQMPFVQYPTAVVTPPVIPKYYQNAQYSEATTGDELQENEVESPKQYATQTEVPYTKSQESDYPRYYSSRNPVREEQRYNSISELPPPHPLLLKSPLPHLSHIPKALPMYRPLTKPVYAPSYNPTGYSPKPSDAYGIPYKRRPMSLLDSYVPSTVQLEYLKRGYAKDPLVAYEALSSGRHYPHGPRQYERGFLPNQMYHTAAGGVTYGHYKRTPKIDKVSEK